MTAPTLAYTIRNNLYLNVTDRCTLKCAFCPKNSGTCKVDKYDLTLARKKPGLEEMIQAIDEPSKYEEVVFCGYGEPSLRLKLILELAEHIKIHGGRVRLNTDGLANLVYRRNVLPEMQGRIDAISVSMNTDTAESYNRYCRPTLKGAYAAMLDFIKQAPNYIPDVTATAIQGLKGVDIIRCEDAASVLGVKFRRRQLGVVG